MKLTVEDDLFSLVGSIYLSRNIYKYYTQCSAIQGLYKYSRLIAANKCLQTQSTQHPAL
jgi:hypothetical protein